MRTAFSPRLAADPSDPTGGKPDETPASPKVVAKTAIKTPRELSLEKELARTQDEVTSLREWQKEVNSFLGEGFGKPVPVKIKQVATPATISPATQAAALAKARHEVDSYIFGSL